MKMLIKIYISITIQSISFEYETSSPSAHVKGRLKDQINYRKHIDINSFCFRNVRPY